MAMTLKEKALVKRVIRLLQQDDGEGDAWFEAVDILCGLVGERKISDSVDVLGCELNV